MTDQLKLIEQIAGEYREIVNKWFPDHFVRGSGSSGPSFDAHFATENHYWQGTDYSYNGELKFFHLTTYRNLFSILNSRVIRLYNLHNANDPEEYEFSAKLLKPSQQELDHRKDNIYTFSFCPLDELDNENVWNLYGQNFSGVAIVFEIINDPNSWNHFHLSDIKYNLSSNLENYVEDVNALKNKYRGTSFYLELEKIMAFHKPIKWKEEKEVRILTYNPYRSWEEVAKFSKLELKIETNRNRFTKYIELNLCVDNDSSYLKNTSGDPKLERKQSLPTTDYFETNPKIKISNILFGHNCGLSSQEYYRFIQEIERLINYNFGYRVNMNNNMFSL